MLNNVEPTCPGWSWLTFLDLSSDAEIGHQAPPDGQVRPCQDLRPAPDRTLDARIALQRQRPRLEPRNANPGEIFWKLLSLGHRLAHKVTSFNPAGCCPAMHHRCSEILSCDVPTTMFQVKSFEVCDLPVRAAKFVARKNWVVTGSDDMQVRKKCDIEFRSHFKQGWSIVP